MIKSCDIMDVYALLDGGPDAILCSTRILERLKLSSQPRILYVQTAEASVMQMLVQTVSYFIKESKKNLLITKDACSW